MSRLFRLWPLVLTAVLGCSHPSAPPPAAAAPAAATEARFPVPVIEMSGSGADLGASQARQLSEPIHDLFTAYFGRYFRSDTERNLAFLAAAAFRPHLAPEHRDEIRALATTLKLDEREVL